MPRKNARLIYIFLISQLASLGINFAKAQTTKVSGWVIDASSKSPLPFVNIHYKGTKIGTQTDMEGTFSLESYYATDSLIFTLLGYKNQTAAVKKYKSNEVKIELYPSSKELREIVINAKNYENPAWRIIRGTIANKDINNKSKLNNYEYEVYSKTEFDLKNFDEKLRHNIFVRPFRFIFNYVDTIDKDIYLPLFISESLSKFYFRNSTTQKKELILATKTAGMQNESVSKLMGDSYQNINIYDNNVMIFGRSFVSPISENGFNYYHYYLTDSAYHNNRFCYLIKFKPKRKQELTFEGSLWINDTTFAVQQAEAGIAKDANINYIQKFSFNQKFEEVQNEVWMQTEDNLNFEAAILIPHKFRKQHFTGSKKSTYRNFTINAQNTDSIYSNPENIIMKDSANYRSNDYWIKYRHDSLSGHDKDVYTIADSIPKVPIFKFYRNLIKGYYPLGKVELGPYFTIYSFNALEGNRFKLNARSSIKFHKRIGMEGFTAYGTLDKKIKYGGKLSYFFKRIPRSVLSFSYKNDVEQFGLGQQLFKEDNIINSLLRQRAIRSYNNVQELNVSYEKDWFNGFGNKFMFRRKVLIPIGDLVYDSENTLGQLVNINKITTVELSIQTRFAYAERFLSGNFNRISLGTQFPIVDLKFNYSMKGFLGGDYSYQKLVLSVKDKIKLGVLGTFKYRVEAGKIWGKAPYPILEIHTGNETKLLNDNAFNTMNYFEFVSDQFASMALSHHFEGLVLNKIPLLRKLNWREVIAGKALIGSLSRTNQEILNLPSTIYKLGAPYYEASAGVENIFNVMRVDALWRLSYLDHPNISKFGIRIKAQLEF